MEKFELQRNSQRTGVSTFASRTRPSTGQSLQKSFHLAIAIDRIQNIFARPSKKIKTPDTQADTKKRPKLNKYYGLQTRWTRTPAGNSVLPQLAVTCRIEAKCSYQTFVLVDSEVLRNRQLRQHAERYSQWVDSTQQIDTSSDN